MANRFWVSPISATWDGTAGVKWSTTSGGLGGSAVPTNADDVFFDGNSGANIVTYSTGRVCRSLNFTNYVGTFDHASASLSMFGSLTMGTGTTWANPGTIQLDAATGSWTITCNGYTIPFAILQGSAGTEAATYSLSDALLIATGMPYELNAGTFDANNQNLSVGRYSSSNANTRAITMGTGTWTIIDSGTSWTTATATNLTMTASGSTLKFTDTSASSLSFAGGGVTFGNVWFSRGASAALIIITGANTFVNFRDSGTAAHTVRFPNVTTTVSSWTVSGSAGNVITLQRTGAAGTWTISDASGTNSSDYLSISNSAATSGAGWYAGANSTDGGGNTGWIFTAPPVAKLFTLLGVGT